ncbi:hypothetical protein H6K86_11805 [Staphylococcus epidermidis]|nr:hypothetical protein [Staphylococcus epidermidis]MBM6209937.1 hypothetical protein [Staphylococcus epidermidis]MBM6212293.1 hypothetical protein [Staphylococcus epidermidis]MBM6219244.1 hypothetical protein [Staphylococcus epidermidis]MBM6223766.1 hypothetical protein [Staphylococcus epidermidis]
MSENDSKKNENSKSEEDIIKEAKDNLESKKSKKEQRKQDKKIGRKYLKAQFNYRFGYRIKALKQYFKNNTLSLGERYAKPIIYIVVLIILTLLILGSINIIQGTSYNKDINHYQNKVDKLKSQAQELNAKSEENYKKIDNKSVSNQTGIKRGKSVINKVIKGMYDYEDNDEYQSNRKEALSYFKNPDDNNVKNVYSEAKDRDGGSLIDNLGLSSEVNDDQIYTKAPDDTKKKVVPFKVVVSYTSYIEDVSSEYSSRTHYTTYKIDFDTSDNKIKNIKKLNSVKLNNDIS